MSTDEYPERQVMITVEVTTSYTAVDSLDERDYLDWLNGREDDDEAMLDYLNAGDTIEIIGSIYDAATVKRTTEVTMSEITSVTLPETEATR